MSKNIGAILAGGIGQRFGAQIPKQFVKVNGKMIIEYTLENVAAAETIDEIYLTINPNYTHIGRELQRKHGRITKIIAGGRTRTESIYNTARRMDEDVKKIVFIDAVRPFVPPKVFDDFIALLDEYPIVKFCSKIVDYLVYIGNSDTVQRIDDRSKWRLCKAPIGYRAEVLREILAKSNEEDILRAESDLQLALEKIPGIRIHTYESDIFNYKITYKEDLEIARRLLQAKKE